MAEPKPFAGRNFDHILSESVTKREFSPDKDALRSILIWDQSSGVSLETITLIARGAKSYLAAVSGDFVTVNDAINDPTVHANGPRPKEIRLMKPVARAELIQFIEKALGQAQKQHP